MAVDAAGVAGRGVGVAGAGRLGVRAIDAAVAGTVGGWDARVRRSCGSADVHIAQSHPITGTPVEVPEPNIVISIKFALIMNSSGTVLD